MDKTVVWGFSERMLGRQTGCVLKDIPESRRGRGKGIMKPHQLQRDKHSGKDSLECRQRTPSRKMYRCGQMDSASMYTEIVKSKLELVHTDDVCPGPLPIILQP